MISNLGSISAENQDKRSIKINEIGDYVTCNELCTTVIFVHHECEPIQVSYHVMYRSTRILSNSEWLERFESLLGYLTVNWNGLLVLLGDINIDMLQPSTTSLSNTRVFLMCLGFNKW